MEPRKTLRCEFAISYFSDPLTSERAFEELTRLGAPQTRIGDDGNEEEIQFLWVRDLRIQRDIDGDYRLSGIFDYSAIEADKQAICQQLTRLWRHQGLTKTGKPSIVRNTPNFTKPIHCLIYEITVPPHDDGEYKSSMTHRAQQRRDERGFLKEGLDDE